MLKTESMWHSDVKIAIKERGKSCTFPLPDRCNRDKADPTCSRKYRKVLHSLSGVQKCQQNTQK